MLQHNSDVSLYLEKLSQTKRSHPLIGLSPEEWQQHIRNRTDLSLELIGLQPLDVYPVSSINFDSSSSKTRVSLNVLSDGKDIPHLISASNQNIKAGFLQHAHEQLQQALEFSIQSNTPGWLSEIYHQQGILQTKLGQYATADRLLERALHFPHRAPYLNNRSAILANLWFQCFLAGKLPGGGKFSSRKLPVSTGNQRRNGTGLCQKYAGTGCLTNGEQPGRHLLAIVML